jgi:deoxyribodipyrimidine photo-lyase
MRCVIHWFRRDLRLRDNTALRAALQQGLEVIPVYILSRWRGKHRWTGPPRQEFLCGSLEVLARNLEKIGARLIIRQGPADEAIEKLIGETGAEAIFFNRDPDPFGRGMEAKVAMKARARGVSINPCQDTAVHDHDQILTGKGEPFRVFTPYEKAWRKLPPPGVHAGPRRMRAPAGIASLPLPALATWGLASTASIIQPGEDAARERLDRFMDGPILRYAECRDFPAADGTSRLSQDLRHGLLSPREVHARALAARKRVDEKAAESIERFITELIWREFYMQILWHWPNVLDQDFNPGTRDVRWFEPGPEFDAWRNGETGFPIVDAAMRSLAATGFMHNRLRMITAMFLTKDLHVHWQHGESHFMQHLVDGDIASNNGGWQWSAGTGADAAPYFRIQNPWVQSARFDPKAEFIKKWVPELRDVHPAALAVAPERGRRLAPKYPLPIVDHAKERAVTLELFRA